MVKIKRVLISVSDKTGLIEMAKELVDVWGVEIVSTGGTASAMREAGLTVKDVSEETGFPEILDGRVKTLHPHIAAAILADRRKASHIEQLEKYNIKPFDMVIVNLYPFAETIRKPGVTRDEEIENIDIGGPTMIRAAAKNFENIAVVTSSARYQHILDELKRNSGEISRDARYKLMVEAFGHTADYDENIFSHFNKTVAPETDFAPMVKFVYEKKQDLRYGENPHQSAAFYVEEGLSSPALATAKQLHGKELSYNNILDLDSAWSLCLEFGEPVCVIVKHNNPCGVAISSELSEAYEKAYLADSVSAFGGIVAFNRQVDQKTAEKMAGIFYEAVIAPSYEPGALEVLMAKKDLRLMDMQGVVTADHFTRDIRKVDGGLLVQTSDRSLDDISKFKVVTQKDIDHDQEKDLLFAWKVAKHVKSNAIVFAKNGMTTGIGAGQMSRVDSVDIAVKKGGDKIPGSVLASDAFFPFRDGVDLAASSGASAVIQPGGSIRDEEVIAAANDHNIGMILTGIRHFRH